MLQSASRGGVCSRWGACLLPRGSPCLRGCLLPEGVSATGGVLPAQGGLPTQGGVCSRGVSAPRGVGSPHPGGFSMPGGSPCLETPPVNRITHTCKNITLATTSLRPVTIKQKQNETFRVATNKPIRKGEQMLVYLDGIINTEHFNCRDLREIGSLTLFALRDLLLTMITGAT